MVLACAFGSPLQTCFVWSPGTHGLINHLPWRGLHSFSSELIELCYSPCNFYQATSASLRLKSNQISGRKQQKSSRMYLNQKGPCFRLHFNIFLSILSNKEVLSIWANTVDPIINPRPMRNSNALNSFTLAFEWWIASLSNKTLDFTVGKNLPFRPFFCLNGNV